MELFRAKLSPALSFVCIPEGDDRVLAEIVRDRLCGPLGVPENRAVCTVTDCACLGITRRFLTGSRIEGDVLGEIIQGLFEAHVPSMQADIDNDANGSQQL